MDLVPNLFTLAGEVANLQSPLLTRAADRPVEACLLQDQALLLQLLGRNLAGTSRSGDEIGHDAGQLRIVGGESAQRHFGLTRQMARCSA